MTLLELREELKSILGNRSSSAISSTRYNLWLNNTEIEIASAFQFFQLEKKATTTMVASQALYNLPSDCLAIYDLRDNTEERKIRRTHYRKRDNLVDTSGDPTHYIRFGNCIELIPIPDAGNTMQLRYCKNLTAMSADSDTPSLPIPWHECILLGAEMRGWRALGEVKKRLDAKNEYLAMIRSRQGEWEIEDSDEEFGIELVK